MSKNVFFPVFVRLQHFLLTICRSEDDALLFERFFQNAITGNGDPTECQTDKPVNQFNGCGTKVLSSVLYSAQNKTISEKSSNRSVKKDVNVCTTRFNESKIRL